jgi:Flp pilus assembly protein CpaB
VTDVRSLRRRTRRFVLRRRRPLAALTAGLAALLALEVLAPTPDPTVRAVAAARDLAAGSTLTAGDLVDVRLPRPLRPDGLLARDALLGRVLSGAVRRGEALTDARLTGAGTLAGLPRGQVAVPLRVSDAAAAALLRPGDRVDVHAVAVADAGAGAGPGAPAVADLVLPGLVVLAVPPASDGLGEEGALVVVAATPETARTIARAAVAARFSVAVRSR